MGHREGAHRFQQHPAIADQQDEPQHEQQMIDARKDVLHAERQIGRHAA